MVAAIFRKPRRVDINAVSFICLTPFNLFHLCTPAHHHTAEGARCVPNIAVIVGGMPLLPPYSTFPELMPLPIEKTGHLWKQFQVLQRGKHPLAPGRLVGPIPWAAWNELQSAGRYSQFLRDGAAPHLIENCYPIIDPNHRAPASLDFPNPSSIAPVVSTLTVSRYRSVASAATKGTKEEGEQNPTRSPRMVHGTFSAQARLFYQRCGVG